MGTTHLDEHDLVRLMAGDLDGQERRRLDQHVDRCASCQDLLVQVVRRTAQPGAERPIEDTALGATLLCTRAIAPMDDDATASDEAPAVTARYLDMKVIARGGMGEVLAVRDATLDRVVALKRIRADLRDPERIARFVEEARLLASLEHPSIIPLHDAGQLDSGEAFFTMKLAPGATLADIIRGLKASDPEIARTWTPTRLWIAFLHVLEAIEYAHSSGVLHCDLKPANVLVGAHREILVADWGLARKKGELAVVPVDGTPLYMAPERFTGKPADERSDVYSLGAMLYELLTLETPIAASSYPQLLVGLFAKAIESPRARCPEREIPEELDQLAMSALARSPAERIETVSQMRTALERVLAGERRRETALERFGSAEEAEKRWRGLQALEAELEGRRLAMAKGVKSWDGPNVKQPLWDLEERLFDTRLDRDGALSLALDGYGQAIAIDPRLDVARDRYADLELFLFLEAEQAGDRRAQLLHRRQVELHHRGRHADVLSGNGTLAISTEPGARIVRAVRMVERGKQITPGEVLNLAFTDGGLASTELPHGSYLFEVQKAASRPCRVHVLLARGDNVELSVRTVRQEGPSADFIHVPAGPFISGGDHRALNGLPRQRRSLPDFLIARFPVTCAEYVEYLNALDPHVAERHVPRTRPDGGALWEQHEGGYVLPKFDADGNPVLPSAPVMGVSFVDAQAFAAWRARRDGLPIRLPTEDEWEKAARGADGRFFPWGNGFDATFCKMALSRPGRPQPEPVGSFATDVSVYGMQDAAGGIREWCDSWYDEAEETRVLRGGAWYFNADYCRLAFRHGYLPHIVFANFGIRLACSI